MNKSLVPKKTITEISKTYWTLVSPKLSKTLWQAVKAQKKQSDLKKKRNTMGKIQGPFKIRLESTQAEWL